MEGKEYKGATAFQEGLAVIVNFFLNTGITQIQDWQQKFLY